MSKETREHLNAHYKKLGKPLPYPQDKVKGEVSVPEKSVQKAKTKETK